MAVPLQVVAVNPLDESGQDEFTTNQTNQKSPHSMNAVHTALVVTRTLDMPHSAISSAVGDEIRITAKDNSILNVKYVCMRAYLLLHGHTQREGQPT